MVMEGGGDGVGKWGLWCGKVGVMVRERKWPTVNFDFCRELTFDVVVYNIVAMEIMYPLQHTPQDVLHVVHN